MANITVIGSGFSGLSAACHLAHKGHKVCIYEKNSSIGGRARQLEINNFKFDMGPTWYWMPEVFDSFFSQLGKNRSDYYSIERLSPGYEVYFDKQQSFNVSANKEELIANFEKIETGSGIFLSKFLKEAEYNYKVAMEKVIHKPGKSPFELLMPETAAKLFDFTQSISRQISKGIKDQRLRQLLEFPVLFLGAKPEKTPAFYKLMNHADMNLGTWYVKGGMFTVIEAFEKLAKELGVSIYTSSPIEKINCIDKKIESITVNNKDFKTDFVVSGADYWHTETLLPKEHRNYSDKYWDKRTFAPSALLFYVGFNRKIKNVSHHTLFFDTDFKAHASNIYDQPGLPKKPLFYASFPSKTDDTVCPKGKEAAIFLIPTAPGLSISETDQENYFKQIIERLEYITDQELSDAVEFKVAYCGKDFMSDYNACKGNAYGLANTLSQTAFLKPKIESKKLKNLIYTGQLTVPGPGVPPAIISGKIAADLTLDKLN